MRHSERLDHVEFDPEIERTFRQRRREQRVQRGQQQSSMEDNENQLVQMERAVEINERDILMGDFMMPPVVENRSSIVYPPYGHDNFQLRLNLAKILTERQPSTWPSNTEVNPKEQVNAITTRSGVQLSEIHVKRPSVAKENGTTKETTDQDDEPGVVARKVKVALLLVKPYVPPIPFPQRLRKHKLDKQFEKFLEVFKKLHINIPFVDALAQMPSYVKFMKKILSNKRKLKDHETVMLTEESSAILQNKLPPKLEDPRSFTIPYTIGSLFFERALCDLGASINRMPYSIFRKLGLKEPTPTTVFLQLADRNVEHVLKTIGAKSNDDVAFLELKWQYRQGQRSIRGRG
ncbi:uncharacterized protein LOC127790153 [Diospyros lotus]|uniref:uncharacterized protein LOC127790153 n=1 Tax=Diospyros lotus TaxID=55363 RepID=UPI002252E848|nr:uncharacterized protein LOC127790153 [Diospyros lotus]